MYDEIKMNYLIYISKGVECGDIDDISNGKIKQFGTTYLDKAILTCDPGYLFTGSSEITCMANGEWSEKPRCLGK